MEEAANEEVAEEHHSTRATFSIEEEIGICKFLHDRTHDPTDGLLEKFRECPRSRKLWNEYKKETGSDRSANSLASRLNKTLARLHEIPISVEMKLDLYYSLSQPIHKSFVEEARKNAHLALDEEGNIEAFEMKTQEELVAAQIKQTNRKRKSSSVETVDGEVVAKAKKTFKRFTEAENVEMMTFVSEKICDRETGIIRRDEKFTPTSMKLWVEFCDKRGSTRNPKSLSVHCKKILEKLDELPLELRMKIDLFYGLRLPLKPEFLNVVKEHIDVKVDENGIITEYDTANSGREAR